MQKRTDKHIWKRTGVAIAVIVVCLTVLAGTAWARYQLSRAYGLQYEAKSNASVHLGKGIDAAGNLVSGQSEWLQNAGVRTLAFTVGNGTGPAVYEDDDQKVSIRLISSPGFDLSGADVFLYIEGETSYYRGTVQQIAEHSPLYETFGPGWFVDFSDPNGNELNWNLEGGGFSWLSARLEVHGGQVLDSVQFRLQITGDKSIRE